MAEDKVVEKGEGMDKIKRLYEKVNKSISHLEFTTDKIIYEF